MAERRVIYNDDFRTIMAHDQIKFGLPASAADWRALIERVRGTAITTYVMDSIEYDNKIYFETERGIDWAKIDFARFDGDAPYHDRWSDSNYARAGRVMQGMRAEGMEPLQVFIDSCRDMGLEALAGIRMNDCHGIVPLARENPDVSFFLKEHPEYAVRFPGTDEPTRLADYGHPAVRDYRFSILEELLEKFDYDGIELNWVRFPCLFQPDNILHGAYGYITEERFAKLAPILTAWMVKIRRLLDRIGARRKKDRMVLGIRVPETPEITRAVGIDLPAWIQEVGLDYIVPTGFHSTVYNIPVERFKRLCGQDCAVYPSLFPNVGTYPKHVRTYQTAVYAAAAHTHYAAGADGVEVFNHFHPACRVIGLPFNSEALKVIASPEATAAYPLHHYYIMYSAQPDDVPACAHGSVSGVRGVLLSRNHRAHFEFRAGQYGAGPNRLSLLRFKIFEMTPEDELTGMWLNEEPLTYKLEWRQRFAWANFTMPSRDADTDPLTLGWRTARSNEDLQPLAGEAIPDEEVGEVRAVLARPYWRRPEWTKLLDRQGDGLGRDIFMLVSVDVAKLSPAAMRTTNRLWVRVAKRDPEAVGELFMGELELVFAAPAH